MPKPFVKGDPRAGRTKGAKNKKTIEMEVAQKQLQQSILANITPLTVAALNSAIGERYVYRIETTKDGGRTKAEVVTDQHEISDALEAIENDAGVIDQSFYYVSVKPSDTRSLQALFDRAFGKAKETVDMNIKGELSLRMLAQKAEEMTKSVKKKA